MYIETYLCAIYMDLVFLVPWLLMYNFWRPSLKDDLLLPFSNATQWCGRQLRSRSHNYYYGCKIWMIPPTPEKCVHEFFYLPRTRLRSTCKEIWKKTRQQRNNSRLAGSPASHQMHSTEKSVHVFFLFSVPLFNLSDVFRCVIIFPFYIEIPLPEDAIDNTSYMDISV